MDTHRVSAIESGAEHPDAADIISGLKERYKDVLFQQHLARNVDEKVRGPHGVATIELKDGAVPHKKRPFRMQAGRKDALRKVIDSNLERGWIETSMSEWCAQAFLVPKPVDPKNQRRNNGGW